VYIAPPYVNVLRGLEKSPADKFEKVLDVMLNIDMPPNHNPPQLKIII
jgi:hypothetical protein